MGESSFSRKRTLIKERRGCGAEPPGFKVPALMEEQQALVEVDQPGPDEIFFLTEHRAGFCEAFQRLNSFALLCVGRGFVCEGFCRFVAHAKLFEAKAP